MINRTKVSHTSHEKPTNKTHLTMPQVSQITCPFLSTTLLSELC